jgi:uncharacterized protein (DUF983 family)
MQASTCSLDTRKDRTRRPKGTALDQARPEPVVPVDVGVRNECPWCGHLMFKGRLGPGSAIQIKCSDCKGLVNMAAT